MLVKVHEEKNLMQMLSFMKITSIKYMWSLWNLTFSTF